MRELQQQVNKALRELETRTEQCVSIRTEKIRYGMKAVIFVGEIPLIDGYAVENSATDFQMPQLNAIINAIGNYDLTLLD